MHDELLFYAGREALPIIREKGLTADMVRVVAGASGGPKWLILAGLDRFLFPEFFKRRRDPLFMIGSSIGSWRFTAAAQANSLAGITRHVEAYVGQRYSAHPKAAEVTAEGERILDAILGSDGAAEILNHPFMRLSVLAVGCRAVTSSDNRLAQGAGLAATALANAFSRRALALFHERALFSDPRLAPPFAGMKGFPLRTAALTVKNLRDAVMASGSIPMVMEGIKDIAGMPPGVYRDGGLIDYHLDIPYGDLGDGIALFPHYMNRIIPGWYDKHLPWRTPGPVNMARVLMVCPSPAFVERLPHGKIPDRTDFAAFRGRDDKRIRYWRTVLDAGDRLGERFSAAVEGGGIRGLVEPFPWERD